MPINSGNKKVNNAFDQRAAGSDNAQVANLNGRIFNVGGQGNPTAAVETIAETPKVLIVGGVVLLVLLVWAIFTRK